VYLSELVQYIINGIAQGSIYALIALGYTMVYGILKLINFAHGEFYMAGAYFGILLAGSFALPLWLAIPAVMLATGILAVLAERIAYRPLRNADRIAPLITALGVSIFLVEIARVIAGPQPRAFPQVIEDEVYNLDFLGSIFEGAIIQKTQLIILVLSLLIMLGLNFVVMKTKIGRAMRALSMDFQASQLMGVALNRVIAFTFFIGASLAGIAGFLVGMHYNNVEPYMGQLAGLKAFTAAVLGGIGVIPGAVLGAFLLGISENLVVGYLESSYRDAIAFGILILVLMFRPWGLLGKPHRVKV
jgi:branched-chain amino acid transport system permease protein